MSDRSNPHPFSGSANAAYGAPYATITLTPTTAKRNFIVRHWHGELSLGLSSGIGFAGAVFPVPFIAGFVVGAAVGLAAALSGIRLTPATYGLATLPAGAIIALWASVGMFRSGWRNRQRSSGIIVSALAGLLIVWVGLTTIAAIGQVATPAPAPHYHGKR